MDELFVEIQLIFSHVVQNVSMNYQMVTHNQLFKNQPLFFVDFIALVVQGNYAPWQKKICEFNPMIKGSEVSEVLSW